MDEVIGVVMLVGVVRADGLVEVVTEVDVIWVVGEVKKLNVPREEDITLPKTMPS